MKIGELFMELNFKSDSTKLNDFIKMVGDLDMSSLLAATGLGGIYEALKNIMDIAGKAGMEMNKYTTITGMSAQQMDSWSKFAQQMGADGNLISDTFKKLQMDQQKTKTYGMSQDVSSGIGMVLNRTGVNLLKTYYGDVSKYYDAVREGIKGVDDASKRQILSLLGISEQNLLLMKQSDEVYAQRNKQATINTEEVQKLSEFWRLTVKTGQEIGTIFVHIGAGMTSLLTPVMKFVEGLAEALVKSRALQGVLLGIAFVFSLMTGNVLGAIAAGTGLVAYGISNRKEIGDILSKVGKDNGNPLGLPPGQSVGLPPGVGYADGTVQHISTALHFTHMMDKKEIEETAYRVHANIYRQAYDGLPGRGI